ncbi:MAG: M20 family metallopeptidase [Ferrovibrionaceae bacterium]
MDGRTTALAATAGWFDQGHFLVELGRRVAHRTESQEATSGPALRAYLTDEIVPSIEKLGFAWDIHPNPDPRHGPFLIARRIEGADLPTVLIYGHGDVVRGYDAQWKDGLSPWAVTVVGDRWYGRGTADNKGQHSINLAALERVIEQRGRLGFNVKLLIEMGEEAGSPGLHEICRVHAAALAADVLIASDGPRLKAEQPTLFLGSRGAVNWDLVVDLREGGHHSGNWGGLLANPGTILSHAIASMVDARGRILVDGLRPPPIPDSVRQALAPIEPGEPTGPAIDPAWGEPGLTPAERVFGWNALEVLAYRTGNPDNPVNAIPPRASAHMQLRFVVGTDWENLEVILRDHLDRHGFCQVKVVMADEPVMRATRLDPDMPWVRWAVDSMTRSTGKAPAVLPNLGGSLPNDCFAEILGLPTLWVPHSYPACSQHAPNEHMLAPVVREGLQIMTGLFWDLGEQGIPG